MVRQQSFESEPEDDFLGDEETFVTESSDESGGASGFFLFFLGMAITASGVALALAPKISWKLMQVDAELSALGFQHGTIAVGGLIVFCLGFVARAAGSAPAAPQAAPQSEVDSDFMLIADQLATDLAQVLTSLLQMSEELAALGEGQRTLMAAQEQKVDGDQQNAIFRLASSVDQLNARVDERLGDFDAQFRARLDSLSQVVQEVASRPQVTAAPAQPVAQPVAQPAPQPAAPAAPTLGGAFAPEVETTSPGHDAEVLLGEVEETSVQFFDSLDVGSPAPQPPPAADPPSALPNEGMDAIDALLPDESLRRQLGEE